MTENADDLKRGSSYEFRIKGQLQPDWSAWLEGLTVTPLDDGDTLLSGTLPDQAALHGVLARIRDLNLIVVSLRRLGDKPEGCI